MKNESENIEEDSEIDRSGNWWERISLGKARRDFRKCLQEKVQDPEEIWRAWFDYNLPTRTRGESRVPTRLAFLLFQKWEKKGIHLFDEVDSGTAEAIAWCMGTTLQFGAEDPSISLTQLQFLERVYLRYCREKQSTRLDHLFAPLILHFRLGRMPDPATVETVFNAWLKKDTPGEEFSPPSDTRETEIRISSSFCHTGEAQVIIEALLSQSEIDKAIDLARKAVKSNPCISACDLAPKVFLSRLLEPLLDRGEADLASDWEGRLSSLQRSPASGIAELGYRAAYFARIGNAERAIALIEEGMKPARNPDVSDWRKLEFHLGAARALRIMGVDADAQVKVASDLADRFDRRNGNSVVGERVSREIDGLDQIA